MSKSTANLPSRKAKVICDKPPKPYPKFPLCAANCGSWQKKINGKIYYFGKWGKVINGVLTRIQEDGCWAKALELYQAQAEALYAGRRPRVERVVVGTGGGDGPTVKELGEKFMQAKHRKMQSGELGARMFEEYRQVCQLLADTFGKERLVDDLAADDFEELRAAMAKRWGPVRLSNVITRIKSVFKYALDNNLIDRQPRYGSEFKKPDKAVMRRHKAQNGEKMFEAEQLRTLINTAGVPLKAMILLGINAGFGNFDVASLPTSAVDLTTGWLDFARPKTGVARRCPLWPETVEALEAAIAVRPSPKDKADADIVFLLPNGRRWVRNTEKSRTDAVSVQFGELLKHLKLHKPGLNYYGLRHTHRTVSDAGRDPVAIDLIMGHSDPSMGANYRERIDDSRLVAVADHVRQWLFGNPPDDGASDQPTTPNDARRPTPIDQGQGDVPRPRLRLYQAG